MTGLEALAGAAAVGVAKNATTGALQSARDQKREEQKALLEAAKETNEFKTAARIKGNKMAVKEALGLIIMKPLAGIMGISREYFETNFAEDYASKIANVPEESLQTPKASIAGPAFEGLAYSLDEPALKEMYLELLARASDERFATSAHPSFVQIIRELTTAEALYLPRYLRSANLMTPIVQYRALFQPSHGSRVLITNVLDIQGADGIPLVDPMIPTYVDNWVRLKLVSTDYASPLVAEGTYGWAETRPERMAAQAQLDADRTPEFEELLTQRGIQSIEVDCNKGHMASTNFGHQFAQVVGMLPRP